MALLGRIGICFGSDLRYKVRSGSAKTTRSTKLPVPNSCRRCHTLIRYCIPFLTSTAVVWMIRSLHLARSNIFDCTVTVPVSLDRIHCRIQPFGFARVPVRFRKVSDPACEIQDPASWKETSQFYISNTKMFSSWKCLIKDSAAVAACMFEASPWSVCCLRVGQRPRLHYRYSISKSSQ